MKQDSKKMYGDSSAPMTRLKELWRELPEGERDEWQDLFVSNMPSVEIREKIMAKWHIPLLRDSQLCRFRDWAKREREQEELEESMNEDYRYWEERFGPAEARSQARNKFLACSYARAFRHGDYQSGFRAMRADCRERQLDLAVHNSSETFKDAQVRALEFCLDDAKKHPEVVELFKKAFTALGEAREQG